jgi:hypothetical protein
MVDKGHYFDSVNEKSQVNTGDGKGERSLEIIKEVARQQKTTGKPRQQKKAANSSKSITAFPGRGGDAEDAIRREVKCLRAASENCILECFCWQS